MNMFFDVVQMMILLENYSNALNRYRKRQV